MDISKSTNHTDYRGTIYNIVDGIFDKANVSFITFEKDAIRGNHRHQSDSHYCFISDGLVLYIERLPDGTTHKQLLKVGDIIYTPPLHDHAFKAIERSSMVCVSAHERNQKDYELDTIRLQTSLFDEVINHDK